MRLKILLGTFLMLHSTSAILEPISGLSSNTLDILEKILEENQDLKNDIKYLKSKVALQDDEIKELRVIVSTFTEKVVS